MPQLHKKSLGVRIVGISLAMLLVVIMIGMFLLYYIGKTSTERAIGEFGENLVTNAASHFDGDQYEQFLENPVDGEVYWELRDQLNDVREKSSALYLYTVAINEADESIILVDGQPDGSEEASPIGEITESHPLSTFQKVLAGETVYSDVIEDPIYGDYLTAYTPITNSAGTTIGILGIDIDAAKVDAMSKSVLHAILPIILLIFFAIFVFTAVILLVFVFRQLKPLQSIKDIAEQIADGHIKTAHTMLDDLPEDRQDEIGQLSKSIESMVLELEEMITQVTTTSELVAASSEELFASADVSLDMNAQIKDAMEDVASGATEQLYQTEKSTESMQEMRQGIDRIASSAVNASDSAVTALTEAENGRTTITKVVAQMQAMDQTTNQISSVVQELANHSKQIEEMLDVITDIAEQTNLLALNAAIEAARAGEHGKGFAVVADEVRRLADQSKQSVDQITTVIRNIHLHMEEAIVTMEQGRAESQAGVGIAHETDTAFEHVLAGLRGVADEIQDVSASSQQIAANAEKVSEAMVRMDEIAKTVTGKMQNVSASTEGQVNAVADVSSASQELSTIGQDLQDMLQRFRE